MERDVELRVKGHLYDIESVNDEVLESCQGVPAVGTWVPEDVRDRRGYRWPGSNWL